MNHFNSPLSFFVLSLLFCSALAISAPANTSICTAEKSSIEFCSGIAKEDTYFLDKRVNHIQQDQLVKALVTQFLESINSTNSKVEMDKQKFDKNQQKFLDGLKCFYCSVYFPRCIEFQIDNSQSFEYICKSECERMFSNCGFSSDSHVCDMFDDFNCVSCSSHFSTSEAGRRGESWFFQSVFVALFAAWAMMQ
eukprot:TRINITY_DN4185_c0_g1_i1.p1 TRINITY_DN4185_c0_g1~~TRINITY_DN4185_c0_g1_i1.p1  ORF type:complete len:194 (-),score=45.91 TRINITY_DN4185_c0_g1_i1:203-784(-)